MMTRLGAASGGVVAALLALGAVVADDAPIAADQQAKYAARWRETIEAMSKRISTEPKSVEAYSRRGDARFFLGRFDGAVQDYEEMVRLDPEQDASHWRLGIAYYYAGKAEAAAAQFGKYHAFDQVDRENGIWRYLSQYKSQGKAAARKELLKYEKDDREPFPAVYKLFAGEVTPQQILDGIAAAKLDDAEREKRLFYAELYIGLNAAAEGQPEEARSHLRAAVANQWGPRAGYGPAWMWQVGRLHWEQLEREAKAKK